MAIRVDLGDLPALSRRVTTALEAIALSRLKQDLAAESLRQTQQRFSRREAPDGSKWPPRKDNLPHPLLEKSRRLRRSIRAVPSRDGVDQTAEPPYAGVHQHGSRSRNIPQRQFLGWSDSDENALAVTSEEWMARYVADSVF